MSKTANKEYLDTLLRYYEEEVMGEAYFYGLVKHFDETEKLQALARVERHAADAVLPLLEKYQLSPRDSAFLEHEGQEWVKRHDAYKWKELIAYMARRYPEYLDDFARLEAMAPDEDLPALKMLTRHEVAAIEFAERELAADPASLRPLENYLAS